MIIATKYSIQGSSHVKGNVPCQDASIVKDIIGNWVLMATADGVGSCKNSAIGSDIAVNAAADIITDSFPEDGSDDGITALIRTAFNHAMHKIVKRAEEDKQSVESYDTTLDVVIFNGGRKLYYGHCGDGGIFVLNGKGEYKEITKVQEGEESNSVKPLRTGNKEWEIGIYEDDEIGVIASFTDGIRDKLSPPQLREQKYTINVNLANIFMFVDLYGLNESEAEPVLSEHIKNSVKYLKSPECKITDDITMGLMVNTDIPIDDPQYEEPDYIGIEAKRIGKMYPAMSTSGKRRLLERYINNMVEIGQLAAEKVEDELDRFFKLTAEEQSKYNEEYHASAKSENRDQRSKSDDKKTDNTDIADGGGKTLNSSIDNDDGIMPIYRDDTPSEEKKPQNAVAGSENNSEGIEVSENEPTEKTSISSTEDEQRGDCNTDKEASFGSMESKTSDKKKKGEILGIFRFKKKHDSSQTNEVIDCKGSDTIEIEKDEEQQIAQKREATAPQELDIPIATDPNDNK